MFTTADLLQVNEIIEARHGNPHSILGLHEYREADAGSECLVIRVYIPNAKAVTLIDPACEDYQVALEKIHVEGFFEKLIKDRSEWFRYKLLIEDFEGNSWECYDPYSFMPVISSFDLHLFGEGTHYRIYDKLGAHPMSVDGVEGVLFAVWAPNAHRVSVVGSFNNWDGRRHPMRVLENSGIWEIFIPGLKNGDNYKYEIFTSAEKLFLKSDPYGSFMELRPGTASLVWNMDYKWGDAKWFKKLETTDIYNQPINIYELHLGSWKRHGEDGSFLSYIELAEQLIPYVKNMGYTHIELMPVMEHPFDGSWGYQIIGYFAPTSRYGNPTEFMYFVDKCHQSGIGVLLDWAPAHFPKDSSGLARFDGTALYEHEDPRLGEHPDWGTLIFNYGRREVKNFLIANALYWVEKFHVDGLRVDAVASMLYLDYGKSEGSWIPNRLGGRENLDAVEFFKHLNSIMADKHPKTLMVAEESTSWAGVTRDTKNEGLGFSFKWNMGWMNDFLTYVSKEPVHRKYHHNNLTFGMVYAYSENFILVLSHDEVVHGKKSLINKLNSDIWQQCANLRNSLMFMFGHPGKKLIFMGGEFGQFDEWNEERELDWFLLGYPHHAKLQKFTKDLNKLYKKERAFWYDDFAGHGFEWIDCNDYEHSIISFMRKSDNEKDKLIFVCNFTPATYESFRIGLDGPGSYKEIFNSDDDKYGGSNVRNEFLMSAERIEWNGRPYSIQLRVPPMAGTILKLHK